MRKIFSVLLMLVCLCDAAAAEEPDAKSYFNRARTAYALGRYAEAADLFEKTFEIKPDPAILYNAAQAHRLAGNKQKALVLYKSYLRLYGEQANSAEVERRIADLKTAIEAEQAAKTNPPTGLLHEGQKEKPSEPETAPKPTLEPTAVLVSPGAPPAEKKPLAKRGWFWGAIVGSALVVGGAVALGVVLGTAPQGPDVTLGSVRAN